MRTTILLDDELGARLRAHARKEGKSFSEYLANAGRRALESEAEKHVEPFQLITFRGEGAMEGIDLNKTGELLAAEDLATYGEVPR
jgi:hypothetical protein